jgi:vancomycin resistance protein VanJ
VRHAFVRVALAGVVVIALIEWVLILLRPEHGLLAILQIVAPHLALLGILLAAICLLEPRRTHAVAAVALAVVVCLRFGGDWLSLPAAAASPGSRELAVITWNLEVGSRPGANTVEFLRRRNADLVALQELRPDTAAAIDADPALVAEYPYRVLVPRSDVLGMGLLSRWPILDATFVLEPAIQQATLDLGDGRRVVVVNAHPYHADIQRLGSTNLPAGLDSTIRNADLDKIRARIDGLVGQGPAVIMLGDLNTASSEPAFDRFVDGLREVHREVGLGTGWTWRPSRMEFLGIGLVRIDHVVVSPDVAPLGIGVACPPVGDHCLVNARIAVPGR